MSFYVIPLIMITYPIRLATRTSLHIIICMVLQKDQWAERMDDGLSCEKHLIPKAEAMEGHGLYHQISVFVYVEIGLVAHVLLQIITYLF